MHVLLKAKSGKGKTVINQHGDTWVIERETFELLLIRSLEKTWGPAKMKQHDLRWINKIDDPHFEVERIECNEGKL